MVNDHTIHILFLETSSQDPWLNRVTAALGGQVHGRGFCHVEICVPHLINGKEYGYISSSIYNGEKVTANGKKTFANPGYTVHTETVSTEQLKSILDGIHEANRMEVSFDGLGMYLSVLPFATPLSDNSKTFCSRYVTGLLQMAGLVPNLDPRITTPSKLFRKLRESCTVGTVGTVEHKQGLLKAESRFSIE